jgi:hypothetical protein
MLGGFTAPSSEPVDEHVANSSVPVSGFMVATAEAEVVRGGTGPDGEAYADREDEDR